MNIMFAGIAFALCLVAAYKEYQNKRNGAVICAHIITGVIFAILAVSL